METLNEKEQAYVVDRILAGKKPAPPKRPCIECGAPTSKRCKRELRRNPEFSKRAPAYIKTECDRTNGKPVCGKCERRHNYEYHGHTNMPEKCEAVFSKPCKAQFAPGRCKHCRGVVCSKHRRNEKCPLCKTKGADWYTVDLLPEVADDSTRENQGDGAELFTEPGD